MKKLNKFFVFLFATVAIFFVSNFIDNGVVFASSKVNINTADAVLLDTLPGIGEVKAQAIIDYRNINGLFAKIEDIKNVSGIGDVTYNNMKDFITVGDDSDDDIKETCSDDIQNQDETSVDIGGVCGVEETGTSTLTSLTITTLPTKLSYTIGASFDITGLVVVGTYDNNSTSTEVITASEISGFNSAVATTSQTLTISHKGQTVTFPVSITGSPSGGGSTVYSVHYIQEDLSDYTEPTVFEVSAGRPRLVYLDSSVGLEAKHKISADIINKNCKYFWTFGDGLSQAGEKVEHIYKYAGDYNVVLNGTCGDLKSVSRTQIKVVVPSLSMIQKIDGAVEIINKGDYEINLFGYKLKSGTGIYDFPQDTIISASRSVAFPAEYLKISTNGAEIILTDASGKGVAQINSNFFTSNSDQQITTVEVERFALEYKKLTQINKPIMVTANISNSSQYLNQITGNIPLTASVASFFISSSSVDDQVEDSTEVAESQTPKKGFWSKIFHPIRTIRETFYQ